MSWSVAHAAPACPGGAQILAVLSQCAGVAHDVSSRGSHAAPTTAGMTQTCVSRRQYKPGVHCVVAHDSPRFASGMQPPCGPPSDEQVSVSLQTVALSPHAIGSQLITLHAPH